MQYSISMLSFSDTSRLLQHTLGSSIDPGNALALRVSRFNCWTMGAGRGLTAIPQSQVSS